LWELIAPRRTSIVQSELLLYLLNFSALLTCTLLTFYQDFLLDPCFASGLSALCGEFLSSANTKDLSPIKQRPPGYRAVEDQQDRTLGRGCRWKLTVRSWPSILYCGAGGINHARTINEERTGSLVMDSSEKPNKMWRWVMVILGLAAMAWGFVMM
jgi:hypothetical protein